MPVVLVLVDAWQQRCCGETIAVGAGASFPLELSEHELPVEVGPPLRGVVETLPSAAGDAGLVRAGGVVAFAPALPPDGTRVDVRPLFHEERHGRIPDDVPDTAGTVRRIRIVHLDWEPVPGEERSFRPVPGSERLTDVRRHDPADVDLDLSSLMVDLEVS